MPTYNRADFLAKSIQSVLSQRHRRFELVIVDDGSTDQTTGVVSRFQDPRIVYFKKQNGERAAARNAGIEKASGEYVTFLDSDDVLRENHLSTAHERLVNTKPDVVHLGYDVVDDTGRVVHPWVPLPSPVNDKLIEGNFLSCLGVFVKRDILRDHRFNEDRMLSGSEDYELWMRLAARFPILAFPDSTAMLVNHAARSVVRTDPSALLKRIELLRSYLKKDTVFMERFGSQIARWDAFLDIYTALHLALSAGSKAQAFRLARGAVWQFPAIIFEKRFWSVMHKIAFH